MCQEKRLLKIDEVLEIVGVSKSVLYEMIGRGQFPRPVRISLRAVRWRQLRYRRMAGLPAAGNRGELALMKSLIGKGHQPADPGSGDLSCKQLGVRLVRRWSLYDNKRV